MTPTARNFVLGLTTLIALAGLAVLLLLFGELESILRPRYRVTINCDNAAGIRAGSAIELNGVPVGLVERIEPTLDPQLPVRIVARIDDAVRIPAGVLPYATSSLLGGSATLQFETSPGDGGWLPTDGRATIDRPVRSRLIEEFTSEIDSRMGPIIEAMTEFRALAHNLNELVGPAGEPGSPGNIRTAVEMLNKVLADVQEALAMAKRWLGDDSLRADATTAVRNANVLIEQATSTMQDFSRLAGRLEADAGRVTGSLGPALDELAATMEEVRGLVRRATEGQGTVAQMLNNPDLYNSLNDAAVRLEQALREVQLLAEKVKTEGIPVLWP